MQEIQRADPRSRRHALVMMACGILAGLILIPLFEAYRPALQDWISKDPDSRLRPAFAVLAVAFAVPAVGLAAYFWRIGDRVVRAERFPAPGAAVARDTVVLRGEAARRRGHLMQLLAAILVLAAAGFSIILWRLVLLAQSPGA